MYVVRVRRVKGERTRGIAQPYHSWRDGFDVKVELRLRL